MANWAQEFLRNTDIPQVRRSSQKVGELSLAELARISPLEYGWEYDPRSNKWHYAPPRERIDIAGTVENGVITPGLQGFRPAKSQLFPHGEESFHYHIHPEVFADAPSDTTFYKVQQVLLQLPSAADYCLCVGLSETGYKGLRIVTTLGVTSVGFNVERAETILSEKGALPDDEADALKFKFGEIAETSLEKGPIYTVDRILDRYNTHFDGMVTVDFSNWNHVS